MREQNRRTVLAAAGVLAGAATAARAADRGASGALTLFDPDEPTARSFAVRQSGRKVQIKGDRIRLARRLLSEAAPGRLTVIGRHADLLLLADVAREAGYRAVARDPFPALDGRTGLFIWMATRRA